MSNLDESLAKPDTVPIENKSVQQLFGLNLTSKMNSRNKKKIFATSLNVIANSNVSLANNSLQHQAQKRLPPASWQFGMAILSPSGTSNNTFQHPKSSGLLPKSRLSESPFSTRSNATFEPNNFALSKIAQNLERLADDLNAEKSFDM